MQRGASGLLEFIAIGLFFIVALAAICRKDGDTPVCQAERVAIAPEPAVTPVPPRDAETEAGIKDLLLHDWGRHHRITASDCGSI
jgi:hypothetical protein